MYSCYLILTYNTFSIYTSLFLNSSLLLVKISQNVLNNFYLSEVIAVHKLLLLPL